MKTQIRLTESELKQHIAQCISEALEDEGTWDRIIQGTKSFFGNGYGKDNPKNFRNSVADRQSRGETTANWMNGKSPINLKKRWNAAKTGYQQQGIVDEVDEVTKYLNGLLKSGKITADTTVGELLRQGGKFGKNLDTIKRTANGRISKANNDIYDGMQTGVMGSGRVTQI